MFYYHGSMAMVPTSEVPDTTAGILAAVEDNLAASRRLGAERLSLAYAWAVAHEVPFDAPPHRHVRELGATGLRIDEYAPAELAVSLHTSPLAAQRLVGDAIDLVHRLPRAWAAIQAGELEAWVGRKLTSLTRELDAGAAAWVDAQLAEALPTLPTGRLLSLAEAKVTAADRARADAKAEEQRRRHTLHLGRATEDGSRTLFARCDAGDALRLFALADQIARALQALATPGDEAREESLEMLRARALGILANPALALSLLTGAPDHTDATERDQAAADQEGVAQPPPKPGPLPELLARAARSMRGHTILYLHLTPAMFATGAAAGQATGPGPVARAEQIGALTLQMLIRLLGHEHVTLKPVINLAEHVTSDRYEVPAAISERLHLAKPHDVFPHASCLSRCQDQDHVAAFDPARAAAGEHQTHLGNLAKLTRRHHRVKTHALGWATWQLDDHTHLWRTPHGRYRLVDQRGTHPLALEHIDPGPLGVGVPPDSRAGPLAIELWHTTPTRLAIATDYAPAA